MKLAPVLPLLSSEPRNKAMRATCSAVRRNFSDCKAINSASSSGVSYKLRCRSVRIAPGTMQLTRTPLGPNSRARVRVRPLMAALAVV